MKRSLFLLALMLNIDCKNNSAITPPPTTVPGPIIRSISPSEGKIADVVVISGSGFDSLVWAGISFHGARVAADSFSATTIRVRVPPSASTGPVVVYTVRDSAVGPVFTVLPSCGARMCVAPYYGPLLIEEQSWVRDCRFRFIPWAGEVRADSVIFSQGYCVGDDSYFMRIVRFKNDIGPNLLPSAVDVFLIDREIHGTFTDTLRGVAFVQSWDINGVTSGKVSWFDEVYLCWLDFVFWYDATP